VATLLLAACSSGENELGSRRLPPPDTTGTADFVGAGSGALPPPSTGLAPLDEHAVLGVNPAHGPFRGGGLAVIRGNGFASDVRVWFGELEVPSAQVLATRADRVQVSVPPGTPGDVGITVQNGTDAASRRVLSAGYRYDAFFAQPETAPNAGGSIITLVGSGTSWTTDTEVLLDGATCDVVAVRGEPGGAQELDCRTPAGSEGQKSISITTGTATDTLLGGLTYEPGALLRGGLSGEAISNELTVYVTAPGGKPLPEAYVILGSDFDLARLGEPGSGIRKTDAGGRAPFTGEVSGPVTVTVAAHCYQPFSFVAVPVDTLRAELTPVASPDCGEAQLPNFGGSPARPVTISGELVWSGGLEFQRAGWTNVPAAQRPEEQRAAYVFQPSGDPEGRFRLPRAESAVTLTSEGQAGYEFQLVTGAGSRTLYALAGVENRAVDPPRFTAYALGMLRGIYADPGEVISGLAIAMDRTLDQALVLDLEAPATASRGPDRYDVSVAVMTPEQGFFVLPNLALDAPLPGAASLQLIGLPALVGNLEGAEYAVSVRAVTGLGGSLPQSVLPLINAREASQPIAVRGFVPVPTLTVGANPQGTWSRELNASWTAQGRNVDLVYYTISSGGGLITWSVAAPAAAGPVLLPDLSRLPDADILPGNLEIMVSLAGLPDFDYAALDLADLRRLAWQAYAMDRAATRYAR